MTKTIAGIDLGHIQSLRQEKWAPGIIPINIPTKDSDETEVFDYFGAIKRISIEGIYDGDTATIKAAVDAINALISGNQENSVSLITDQTGTLSVKVERFNAEWDIPGTKATYSLSVVQGV